MCTLALDGSLRDYVKQERLEGVECAHCALCAAQATVDSMDTFLTADDASLCNTLTGAAVCASSKTEVSAEFHEVSEKFHTHSSCTSSHTTLTAGHFCLRFVTQFPVKMIIRDSMFRAHWTQQSPCFCSSPFVCVALKH